MISVPGLAPGRTPALVEQVDLFPTLVEAATMHVGSGPTVVPHCPGDTQASRGTALCTEGFSLLPLLKDSAAPWPKAAFSQFVRGASCCDCTTPEPEGNACCPCDVAHGTNIMGYTVRVDKYRFTAWAEMNQTLAGPETSSCGDAVAQGDHTVRPKARPVPAGAPGRVGALARRGHLGISGAAER